MFSALRKLLPIPAPTRRNKLYHSWKHKGWGDNISVEQDEGGGFLRVHGHLREKPLNGDLLDVRMTSGRSARFVFSEVRHCINPHDMFFARAYDCVDAGAQEPRYVEESEFVSDADKANAKHIVKEQSDHDYF